MAEVMPVALEGPRPGRVHDWAMAWYRSQPIPALDGRTPEALVKSERANAAREYPPRFRNHLQRSSMFCFASATRQIYERPGLALVVHSVSVGS